MIETQELTVEGQPTMPIGWLRPHPNNPRGPVSAESVQELADSIRAQGILQPLVVAPDGVIIAGHRRYEAAKLAGLTEVPVVVRVMSEAEILSAMLVENLQRADLTPVQEARSYQQLLDMGMSLSGIALAVGKAVATVTSRLKLLTLDKDVQCYVDSGKLTFMSALELSPLDEANQRRFARLIIQRKWTQATARRMVGQMASGQLTDMSKQARRVRTEKKIVDVASQTGVVSWNAIYQARRNVCQRCGLEGDNLACQECPAVELMKRLSSDEG